MNEEKKRYDEIQRSVNPTTKIRKVYKIEEDGSKTTAVDRDWETYEP